MNKEKFIMSQARTALKGSWIVIIAMLLVISAIIIVFAGAESLVLVLTKAVDSETEIPKPGKELTASIISCCVYAVMFFLSPLINGFYKSIYTVAHNEVPTVWDLFYYMKFPRLYFKSLLLNLILALILGTAVFAFNFNYVTNMLTEPLSDMPEVLITVISAVLNLVFLAVSVLLISFVYLFFVNYALFEFADDPNANVFVCFGRGVRMFVKNFGNTMRLYFRFAGWIALCFFVVPAFYVLPYMAVSFATSAKWLISMEKGRN